MIKILTFINSFKLLTLYKLLFNSMIFNKKKKDLLRLKYN